MAPLNRGTQVLRLDSAQRDSFISVVNRYAYGLLAIWLLLLGVSTWNAAQRTVIPPIWDQLTYVEKSDSFWTAVKAGKPFNPLNLEPSVRPPGIVLVTAPFGPVDDYRDFYFRSVYLPVVIFALSLLIVGFAAKVNGANHALLIATMCTMPLFWNFEMTDAFLFSYYWGLIDSFLASVAALAAALFVLAAARRSLIWFAAGVCTALLLPLIKPAGFIICGMLVGCWAVLLIIRIRTDPRELRSEILHLILTTAAAATSIGLLAWASINSDYFSQKNIDFGKAALKQLNSMEANNFGIDNFLGFITRGAGFPALVILTFLLAGYFVGRRRGRKYDIPASTGWLSVLGMLVLIFGILVCYQSTLLKQVRYVFPFLLVAAVLVLPLLVVLLSNSRAWLKVLACVSPVGLLFFIVRPGYEIPAHYLLGCSLYSGQFQTFPAKVREYINPADPSRSSAPNLYSMTDSSGVAAVEACYMEAFKSVSGENGPVRPPIVLRPFDWEADPAFVLRNITDSELIAYTVKGIEPQTKPATFHQELVVCSDWLSSDPPPDGTHLILSEGRIRCLHVNDRGAFENAAKVFMQSHEWRPEFLQANQRTRFSPGELAADSTSTISPSEPMDFGGEIRVHRLDYEITGKKFKVTVYTERTTDPSPADLSIFIHQTAADGTILRNHSIPIPRFSSKTYPIERVTAEFKIAPKAEQIGFIVFQTSVGPLLTDERAQDWDHRRMMLPVHPKNN